VWVKGISSGVMDAYSLFLGKPRIDFRVYAFFNLSSNATTNREGAIKKALRINQERLFYQESNI